jgi:hypothetical protein
MSPDLALDVAAHGAPDELWAVVLDRDLCPGGMPAAHAMTPRQVADVLWVQEARDVHARYAARRAAALQAHQEATRDRR